MPCFADLWVGLGARRPPKAALGSRDSQLAPEVVSRDMPVGFRHESFLLRLPFDTGLPERHVTHIKDLPELGATNAWEAFDLNTYLGLGPPAIVANMPSTTLMFSLARGQAIRPWADVEDAWPSIFRWQRKSLSIGRRLWTSAPVRGVRNIVDPPEEARAAVTVVQAVRLAPLPGVYDEDWRWEQFRLALEQLNNYLSGVMSVRRDPEVTPISLRSLPPLVFGFGWSLWPDGSRTPVEWQAYMANDRLPLDHPRMTSEEAELASWVAAADKHPLKQAGDFLLKGWTAAQRGQYAHAVVDAGTAIELLMAGAFRLAAPIRGYPPAKAQNVLEGAFASLCKDHFAVVFGYDREPAKSADALGGWWRDAYLLRNRVVHEGHRPAEPEAVLALEAAESLHHDLGARMSAEEDLKQLLLPIPEEVHDAAEQHGAGPVPRSFEHFP